MADKTRTFVVALLILAILFSAASIFISYAALKLDLPSKTTGHASYGGAGDIGFIVEGNGNLENVNEGR